MNNDKYIHKNLAASIRSIQECTDSLKIILDLEYNDNNYLMLLDLLVELDRIENQLLEYRYKDDN